MLREQGCDARPDQALLGQAQLRTEPVETHPLAVREGKQEPGLVVLVALDFEIHRETPCVSRLVVRSRSTYPSIPSGTRGMDSSQGIGGPMWRRRTNNCSY